MSDLLPYDMDEEQALQTMDDSVNETEALFAPLVQDAKSTLRRIMLNSGDPKMAAKVAESILDRAGHGGKKLPDEAKNTIVISDSQVNLLLQTQKELRGMR